jgi:predicted metal-dependent HD superfamily phosphohydrolase
VVGFTHDIQSEVLNAYRVHDAHYHYNASCPACVAEMISIIYRWYLKQINE